VERFFFQTINMKKMIFFLGIQSFDKKKNISV